MRIYRFLVTEHELLQHLVELYPPIHQVTLIASFANTAKLGQYRCKRDSRSWPRSAESHQVRHDRRPQLVRARQRCLLHPSAVAQSQRQRCCGGFRCDVPTRTSCGCRCHIAGCHLLRRFHHEQCLLRGPTYDSCVSATLPSRHL